MAQLAIPYSIAHRFGSWPRTVHGRRLCSRTRRSLQQYRLRPQGARSAAGLGQRVTRHHVGSAAGLLVCPILVPPTKDRSNGEEHSR